MTYLNLRRETEDKRCLAVGDAETPTVLITKDRVIVDL